MRKILLLLILSIMFACDDDLTQDEEAAVLQSMRQEIIDLAKTVDCTDSDDWSFSPMGAKACGGPSEYVAYPNSLATEILQKIEEYTLSNKNFNKKWGVVSDCALIATPQSITCVDQEAQLIF